MEEKSRVIIAMKGHPGTGKTTLAKAIATALSCPLLDKDDIRDATISLSSTTIPSSRLNKLSYDALWRLAATQVGLGLSVVLDSPLSRREHLDEVLRVASGGQHRVVVIECRPADEVEWRRRVEARDAGWHKPATWRDMERLFEEYSGCTEYDVSDVAKLVVDTTEPGGLDVAVSSVLAFIDANRCPKEIVQE